MFLKECIVGLLAVFIVCCHADTCQSSCEATYPLHTTDKVGELKACFTGCRISFITQLSSSVWENNETVSVKCTQDCENGYAAAKSLAAACHQGCEAQQQPRHPVHEELSQMLDLAWHRQLFQPLHHLGRYCSSMYRNVASYVVSSVDVNDGSTIILQFDVQPQHHQRIVPVQVEEPKNDEEGNVLKRYANLVYQRGHKWLNCVEKRAGLPYWSLVGVLFLSIFFMCWVCCTSCDEKQQQQQQRKHVFKEPIPALVDERRLVPSEKPPPYFIVTAEGCEAGPLPMKQPLLDDE